MAGFFDDTENTTSPVGKSFFDDTEAEVPERTAGSTLKDIGISLAKGTLAAGQGVVGLADIPTGGRVGKSLEDIGVKPAEWQKDLSTQLSPAQQAANLKVDEAKGFLPTVGAMLENPSTIAHGIVETLPSVAAGGVLGKGALAVGSKFAPKAVTSLGKTGSAIAASSVGEGMISAGQTAEQIREATPDKLLTGKQAGLAAASGVGTAAFSVVGGSLAKKLGFADVDTMIVSGLNPAKKEGFKGVVKSIVGGGITEGVFEELPQTIQETIFTNAALDKNLLDGVPEGAAKAIILGGVMGGGANLLPGANVGPVKTEQELELERRAGNILALNKDQFNESTQKLSAIIKSNAELLDDVDKLETEATKLNVTPKELISKIVYDNKNNQALLDKVNSGVKAKEELAKKEYEKLSPEEKAIKDIENKLISKRETEAQKINADIDTINKRVEIATKQYKKETDPDKKAAIADRVFNLRKEKNVLLDRQKEAVKGSNLAPYTTREDRQKYLESLFGTINVGEKVGVEKDAETSASTFKANEAQQEELLQRIMDEKDVQKKRELQDAYNQMFQTFERDAAESAQTFQTQDLSQFDQIVQAKDKERLNKVLNDIVIEPDPQARQRLYEQMFMLPGVKDAAASAEVFGQQGADADMLQRRKELQQTMNMITKESNPVVRQKLYNQMFQQPGVKNAQESAQVFENDLERKQKLNQITNVLAKIKARKELVSSTFTSEQPNEVVVDTEQNISDLNKFFNNDSKDPIVDTSDKPPIVYTSKPDESQEEADLNQSKLNKYSADLKAAYVSGNLEIPQYMVAIDLLARKDIAAIEQLLDVLDQIKANDGDAIYARSSSFKAQGKADLERLIKMLGSQMYQGNLAEITIKEVVQNSFDAVKASLNGKGGKKITNGQIDIITDPGKRIIAIRDNGQGMSKQVLLDAFLTVAGTDKSGMASGDASGGFGMAKAAFLYGNEWIEVSTVKDGTRYKFKGTGSDIISKGINITTEKANKDDHGTVIVIKVPEYVDVDGKQQYIWYPNDLNEISFFKQPLIHDSIEINLQQSYFYEDQLDNISDPTNTLWEKERFEPIKVGKNMDLSAYDNPVKINFDWGSADLYIGKNRNPNKWGIKHNILSAGVFQFNHQFNIKQYEAVPYDIILNIFPTAKADSPAYPFNVRREGWKDNIKNDIDSLNAYVRDIAIGIEAQETVDQFKNIQSLPRIDINNIGTNNVDLNEFFNPPKKTNSDKKPTAIVRPTSVTVKDGQVKGKSADGKDVIFADTNKKSTDDKIVDSSFKADKEAPKAKDFLLDVGIDDGRPIFHNNTNTDYFALAKQNGYSAETFFAEFGSLILKVKDLFVDKKIYGYEILSTKDHSFFFGTSIDKGYHGVNLVVPFKAIIVNPLAIKEKTLPGIVHGLYDTFVHEFAHIPQRNHEQGFSEEVAKLKTKLASDGTDLEIRVALGRLIKKHKNLIELLRNEYEKSTTRNVAKPLNDTEKSDVIASRRFANGSNGSLESGNAERFESLETGEQSREGSGVSISNQIDGRNVKQETSLGNILTQVKSASGLTGQLARFLSDFIHESKLNIKVVIDPTVKSASYTGGQVNTITLRDLSQLETSIHEITHAVTSREMRANPAIREQVLLLMKRVELKAIKEALITPAQVQLLRTAKTSKDYKSNIGNEFKYGNVAYGLLNENEFLAQAMGNEQFQKLLKATTIADKGRLRNAWDAFVEIVMKALGIKQTNKNAFGEALGLIAKLASQENVGANTNLAVMEELGTTEPVQKISDETYNQMFTERNSLVRTIGQTLRMRGGEIKQLIDKGLGSISTRLKNVDPMLRSEIRNLDFRTSQNIVTALRIAHPLLEKTKAMSPEDKFVWDAARRNSDEVKIKQIAEKYGMVADQERLREVLNDIRQDAIDVGYDVGFIEEYWPRIIKDQEGFLQATKGISQRPVITDAIKRHADKLGMSVERFELEYPEQAADIASNTILGRNLGIGGPGNIQARQYETVPPELNKFYMDSDAALMQYIYSMTKKIEARRFFGRVPERIAKLKAEKKRKTGMLAEYQRTNNAERVNELSEDLISIEQQLDKYKLQRDYTENIGTYINDLRMSGRIQADDEKVVRDILDARFHEHGTTGIVNAYKNMAYIDVMGSPISALTQIGDLAWAMYVGKVWTPKGLASTVKNIGKAITKKSEITKEDLGIERIAQEFADGTTLGNAVSWVFKKVQLERIDSIGKEVLINNTLDNYKVMASTEAGRTNLLKQLKPIFGTQSDSVINDLLAGNPTDNVKMLLYHRLLDFQPVALSEMPEVYLKSGNGRIAYMLKTYTIKQFDVFRNEVWHNIKSGEKDKVVEGITNMIKLVSLLTLANAGADELKDFMLGKDVKFEDHVIENFLTMGGGSRYLKMQVTREGLGSGLAGQVLPPFRFINSISKDLNQGYGDYIAGDTINFDHARIVESIPIAGKLYYWNYGRGEDYKKSSNEQEFGNIGKDVDLFKRQLENSGDKRTFLNSNLDKFKQMKLHENFKKSLARNQAVINKLKEIDQTTNVRERLGQLKQQREVILNKYFEVAKSMQ